MNAFDIKGGLAGRMLRVDLSTGRIGSEETSRYASRFIGGRAINSQILLEEMRPETRWSDAENLLIFGAGALTGIAPGGSRMSVDTKNVFSGGKGSANVGGHFGPELKYAGYDHVVISGRADAPCYLWITNDRVELRDAGFLWGKTTYETEALIQRAVGDDRVRVACIGPAGERQVRGALILVDRAKAAGGSGVGCVMGNKNLKAVAVRGSGALTVARPEAYIAAADTALEKVRQSPTTGPMQNQTLAGLYYTDEHNPSWDLLFTVRNGQDDYWDPEKRRRLMNRATGAPHFRKKVLACFNCPAGCMPFSEIDEGPYRGTRGEGFWVNTIMSAAMLDISDPAAMVKAWLLMNEMGLDGDFTAGMSAWAYECFERGLITEKETDGLDLTWGNGDAFVSLVRKMALREGIGDLLACGPVEAAGQVGRGADYFAINVKGQPSIEPFRVPKGWGLGVATSPVAGRHLRGSLLGGGRFGPKGSVFEPHTYDDKAKYVFWQGLTKEIEDATGICIYVGTWSGAHALEVSDYAALLNSVMGLDLTEDDLMRFGRQGRNLEKAFNTLHTGLCRADDLPPRRYMEEPVKSGPYKGHRCDPVEWGRMLGEFYDLQGWTGEGMQTRATLERMDLPGVAERLARAGKLPE